MNDEKNNYQKLKEKYQKTLQELEEVKERLKLFETVANSANVALFLQDFPRYIWVNETFARMFGYTPEEMTSPDFDFFRQTTPEGIAMVKEKFKRRLSGEEVPPYDGIGIRKDGSRFICRVYNKLIDFNGRKILLGTLADITDIRQMEKELLNYRAIDAIAIFARNIINEFGASMETLMGAFSALKSTINKFDKPYKYLELVEKHRQRLLDFLDLLHSLAIKTELKKEKVDFCQVFKKVLYFVASDEKSEYQIELAECKKPLFISADPLRLEQLFLSLLLICQDSMPEGGKITIKTKSERLSLKFCDQHPGIAPGNYLCCKISDEGFSLSHIEPSYNSINLLKEKYGFLKYRLPIAYSIIKEHNGFMEIKSKKRKGNVYLLYFPLLKERKGKREV